MKLSRTKNRVLGGVCGGISKAAKINISIVRILFVILLLPPLLFYSHGISIIVYMALWIIVPTETLESKKKVIKNSLIIIVGSIVLGFYGASVGGSIGADAGFTEGNSIGKLPFILIFGTIGLTSGAFLTSFILVFLNKKQKEETKEVEKEVIVESKKPEYFLLRPEVEKAYGYSHAVKIGNDIKISGAVSMDDEGNPTAIGDIEQQMKNCYADLEKILKHFGCTFDDVVKEDIFTTDMAQMLEKSAYRAEIYKNGFPTGSWLEVKGLALPEFMVEIELEVHKSK